MSETTPDITRIRAYETHIDSIQKSIEEDASKQTAAKIEFLTDYIDISKKAAAGQQISADDFNSAAERYNIKTSDLLTRYKNYISSTTGISDEEKKQLQDAAKKIKNATLEKADNQITGWKKNNPEVENIAANLDNTFISQHLSKAPSINLTLPEGIDTPEKLISALLKNNPGIAIGDLHIRDAAMNFLTNNMRNFKKSGVDTIYLEVSQSDFLLYSKLSIDELKAKLEEITPQVSKKISELWSKEYGAGRSDDLPSAQIKLFLAAKENGVDIVNIDERRPEAFYPVRVAVTNFAWTEAIKKDREQNHRTGKYAAFGGLDHFTGSGLNHYEGTILSSIKTRGFVDDALGLPVIAFDKREAGKGEFALRGTSANGADFYLPAGHCYIDSHKLHKAMDAFDAIPKASFPFNIINGAKAIVSGVGLYREFRDSSECTQQPIHDAYLKQLETATQIAVDAETARINAYAELNKKHAAGNLVSADDITSAENIYRKTAYPFEYIKRQIEKDTSNLSNDLKNIFKAFDKSRLDAIKAWKEENSVINREAIDGMELKYSDADKTTMKQPTQISAPYPAQPQPQLNK
ncbi:MAG: hypothetical protein AABY33_07125 [Pseudomonadota bacterium]